ncbi:MAG: cytochrome P450 [Chloroflexi bacterium]|nr:cytochrome P450 [Chloroflexota bacterium]
MSVVFSDQPDSQIPVNARRKIPPGPRGKPIMGNLREFRSDILGLLETSARAYGEIVHFRVGPREIFLLNDPYYIQHVLQTNSRNYRKGMALVRSKILLGEGLVTNEGDFWLHLIQPTFHGKQITTFGQIMADCTLDMMTQWQPYVEARQPLNMAEEMMGLTLNIVCKALFSATITEQEQGAVKQAMEVVLQFGIKNATRPSFMGKLPTPGNQLAKNAIRQLDEIVYRLIQERRQHPQADGTSDLLTLLMMATDADTGEVMNDRQVRDEVMTLFLAGYETTANALAWTWYLLSENPAAADQLHAELDGVVSGRLPAIDDVLPYTHAVLQESMRLYPPAWVISRQVIGDDEIGGYPIPAGSAVILSPYVMHRNPNYWENPECFAPTRFLGDSLQWRPHYSYFPFGGGARQCIGMNFAMMEAQLVLATVAQSYRIKLVEGCKVEPEALVTLRPRNGINVVIEPR